MTDERKVGNGVLSVVRGDLTKLDLDAFVFYARHDLVLGAGFGNAISARGGSSIQEELDPLAPVETGEAVVTGAGDLPARHIVHAVGPRFQEDDIEGKLRRTMKSALRAAKERGLRTLGLPAMGTGYYGVPLDLCARVMTEEIEGHLRSGSSLEKIVICVQDRREQDPFLARLEAGGGE